MTRGSVQKTILFATVLCTFYAITLEDKNATTKSYHKKLSEKQQVLKVNPERVTRGGEKYAFKQAKKSYNSNNNNYYRYSNYPSLFFSITGLLGGSVSDTFVAFRNVTRIVQQAFPARQNGDNGTSFTVSQALQLFSRNFRGLRRVFDKEFARALNDSDKNVEQFQKEFKDSVRPFFEPNRNLTFT